MTNLPVRAAAGLPAGARSFDEMYRQAEVLSRSDLVPRALQGKPESIVLVGLYGAEHGISLVTALSQVHIIDNKPSPSAQLQLGQAARLGHETRWVETSSEKAVLRARRREDRTNPERWVTFTFTIDDARKAGLLDQYVEKWEKNDKGNWVKKGTWVVGDDKGMKDLAGAPDWVQKKVDAGDVKRRDPWFKYTEDMLCARVATRAAKRMFPDALLALDVDPYTPDIDVDPDTGEVIGGTSDAADPPHENDDAGEVEEAVVVEDLGQGPGTPPPDRNGTPAPDEEPPARAGRAESHPVPRPKPGERQDVADVKYRIWALLPKEKKPGFVAWLEACGIPDTIDVSEAKVAAVDAELDRLGAPRVRPAPQTPPTDG